MAELEAAKVKFEKGESLTPEEEQAVMESADGPVITETEGSEPDDIAPGEEEAAEKTGIEKEGATQAEKKEDAKPEETPSEKKDAETDAAKKEPSEEDTKKELETELDKPAGEEDLERFTPAQRAIFFEMKSERRKRQEAEKERDLLKFQDAQRRIKEKEAKDAAEAKAKAEPEEDPLGDRDDEEFMTVADFRKILAKTVKKTGEPAPEPKEAETMKQLQLAIAKNWELEARMEHDDFLEVSNHFAELLDPDPKAQEELKQTVLAGGNAAKTAYNLVKAHPKWAEIEKSIKAKADGKVNEEAERETNRKRAEKIKENEGKAKTTGAGGTAATGEYSLEEMANMSEEDFLKIPVEKREKLLKKVDGLA